jgi:Putative Actinobacterial Holin-X, holin superfamily III
VQDPGPTRPPEQSEKSVGELVFDVSERTSTLIREEIELAKAEVKQKLASFRLGIVGFAMAAVLALLAIPFGLLTIAWGVNSALNSIWLGFAVVLGVLVLGILLSALFGWRKIKKGMPTPTMAIDEAKKIRETVATKSEA